MSEKYQKAFQTYADAAAKARSGDAAARADKVKLMGDVRALEREAARTGQVLTPTIVNGKVAVKVTETDSRRSLQEEYTRKFDDKAPVTIARPDGKSFKGTMRDYHRQRLLSR